MKNKGYFLVFLTAVISGFSIFINKFSVSVINPYIFTGLKNIIAAVFLSCLFIFLKDLKVFKTFKVKDWMRLVIIGLIGGSIPFLLFFKGLSLTSAAQGSFLHKTMFLYIAVFAAIFLKERISKGFLIGAVFLLAGSALLLKILPYSFGRGDLFVLLAALLWAAENTLSKYALKNLSGRMVAWGRMFFGSIFIIIFLAATHQAQLALSLNLGQMAWTLITSVLLFGYVITWYSGLKYIPVSKAACILLLGSPITTLLSIVFYGSPISLKGILSIAFTIAGIVLIFCGQYLFKGIKRIIYAGS
ncbi:MAG: DMT family transporter [Candidatus Nealsonbacteria bacterium]|nr:DMT family transporter [Candidatus Nealsonbacteria bacterium]